MTIPEAIRWFEAKLMVNERFGLLGNQHEASKLALDALLAQQEAEKNEPLTLEELREMDGEPVWCCDPQNIYNGGWALVRSEPLDVPEYNYGAYSSDVFLDFSRYGSEWLAYRRKPDAVLPT